MVKKYCWFDLLLCTFKGDLLGWTAGGKGGGGDGAQEGVIAL